MSRYSFFINYKDIARLDAELNINFNFIEKTIYKTEFNSLDIDTKYVLDEPTKLALESYVINFEDSDEKNSEYIYVPQSVSTLNVSSPDTYETIMTWNYNGTLKERYLKRIGFTARLLNGSSYSLRIYDVTNNIILGDISLVNTTDLFNNINIDISKLSPLASVLELQVSGEVQVKAIQFVYKS